MLRVIDSVKGFKCLEAFPLVLWVHSQSFAFLDPVYILQNMSSHMGASDIFNKLCKGGTTDFLLKVYENNAEYLFNKKY